MSKGASNYEEGIGYMTSDRYHGIIMSTGNDIPGYRIVRIYGIVYGLTVRSRNIAVGIGAGFKSLVGGELKGLTTNLMRSRDQALDRLIAGVLHHGGNAVYAVRWDVNSMAEFSEITVYGTACTVEPLPGTAPPTSYGR